MVEIPVEKKNQGMPWWGWLLAVVAIALLGWFFLSSREDYADPVVARTERSETQVERVEPAAMTGTAVASGAAITSLDQLVGQSTAAVGRQVSLSDVEVVSADERGGLFIGDGSGERVFVSTSIPSGFAAGSRVNVTGTVQAGSTATTGQTAPPVGLPANAAHYIEADSIQPA